MAESTYKGAVSARNILGPKATVTAPCSLKASTSFLESPPSGPKINKMDFDSLSYTFLACPQILCARPSPLLHRQQIRHHKTEFFPGAVGMKEVEKSSALTFGGTVPPLPGQFSINVRFSGRSFFIPFHDGTLRCKGSNACMPSSVPFCAMNSSLSPFGKPQAIST